MKSTKQPQIKSDQTRSNKLSLSVSRGVTRKVKVVSNSPNQDRLGNTIKKVTIAKKLNSPRTLKVDTKSDRVMERVQKYSDPIHAVHGEPNTAIVPI